MSRVPNNQSNSHSHHYNVLAMVPDPFGKYELIFDLTAKPRNTCMWVQFGGEQIGP